VVVLVGRTLVMAVDAGSSRGLTAGSQEHPVVNVMSLLLLVRL